MSGAILRFAPSPNGRLHLGHAYSALLNDSLARRLGGSWLLRIEDIDPVRTQQTFVDAILADLSWLGLGWPEPVRRQSEHLADYRGASEQLLAAGLLYRCACTRGDIARTVREIEREGVAWPRDPDGAPLYPGTCRTGPALPAAPACALRLDMAAALAAVGGGLAWRRLDGDLAEASVGADPARWGDAVIVRKDVPTSYHLSVVVDDAIQGVTHVVRGADLAASTHLHALLQRLLGLPSPAYCHHRLLRDPDGGKLSKSRDAQPFAEGGASAAAVRRRLGFA